MMDWLSRFARLLIFRFGAQGRPFGFRASGAPEIIVENVSVVHGVDTKGRKGPKGRKREAFADFRVGFADNDPKTGLSVVVGRSR